MSDTDTTPDEVVETDTPTPEADRRNEVVTLLVRAEERQRVARALLAAAGIDSHLVRTTSNGFRVPRWIAVDADLVLAEDAAPNADGSTLAAAGVDSEPEPSDSEPDDPEAKQPPNATPPRGRKK